MNDEAAGFARRLQTALDRLDPAATAAAWLESLVDAGLDRLPMPAHGRTLARWRALALVAARDLSLAKLYEGHTDALAILAELAPDAVDRGTSTWGVWAAEAPQGRVRIVRSGGGTVTLAGTKCWCSGAADAACALLTAWPEAEGGGPQLVAVDLRQPGIAVSAQAWQAVGMNGSASLDVSFAGVEGRPVGGPGDYLARPGFWHGGAGIAACWYGGAVGLADALRRQVTAASAAPRAERFREAALGRVDVALAATAALLRECAGWIDANPRADAALVAGRARLAAEASAAIVLDEVGRALGATPFCRDARFARAAADLPVFVRQSHAERDLAALGGRIAASDGPAWQL